MLTAISAMIATASTTSSRVNARRFFLTTDCADDTDFWKKPKLLCFKSVSSAPSVVFIRCRLFRAEHIKRQCFRLRLAAALPAHFEIDFVKAVELFVLLVFQIERPAALL